MDNIKQILGAGLPDELVSQLQEAFDKKVAEAKEQAEANVREEFAQRFEHDKNALTEAMDRAITDVLKTYETQRATEINALREAQEKYHNGLKEAKAASRSRLKENLEKSSNFLSESLAKEVVAMRKERAALAEARIKATESVETIKDRLTEAHNSHVTKIDEFVKAQVSRELNEFQEDRRALVETRAKLIAESRKAIASTQAKFIKEAARKLDTAVTKQLSEEVKQLHEDIERNRQNHFGRKVFEAVVAEFVGSHYSDSTEARKLRGILESTQAELADARQSLAESAEKSEEAIRKARLSEERSERSRVMSELLSTLRGEKRAVMEGMLDSVKTADLRKSYSRFLPLVTESTGKPAPKSRAPITEARDARVVSGDRANRLSETLAAENNADLDDLAQVIRLAGIRNK